MRSQSLDDLIRVAPPPLNPVEPGSAARWNHVERVLGFTLPADYKKLVNKYGSGDFNDLIVVLNPFATPPEDLLSQVDPLLTAYRQGRELLMPEQCPFPAYPEPGGLFPAAIDTHGGTLYWLTQGHPEDWTLVHYDLHSNYGYQQHAMSLTTFLARWLSDDLHECFFGIGKFFVNRYEPIFRPSVPGHARSRLGDSSRRELP